VVTDKSGPSRIIQIKDGVVGPREPRLRSVKARKITDYPGVPGPYRQIAQSYSNPLIMGPPICDELMALVQHMYSEEEAAIVQHLRPPLPKRAASLAAAAHRAEEEVRAILKRLVDDRGLLFSTGEGDKARYGLLPVVPGAFEMVMLHTSKEALTDWHRRFAELFGALFDTGYLSDYNQHRAATVRYLPVQQAIEAHPMALPSDRLEEILDPYTSFAVGLCQCRLTAEINGHSCGRALENCVAYGDVTGFVLRTGRMRKAEKKEILEIKAEAEAVGLVSFAVDMGLGLSKTTGGASCSCCGCCCDSLRLISEFSLPAAVAPPHFLPRTDFSQCTYCARCAKACPMGAITVDPRGRSYQQQPRRCIGCGLCALACDQKHAIRMEPTPNYRPPAAGLFPVLTQTAPTYLRNVWSAWRKHRT